MQCEGLLWQGEVQGAQEATRASRLSQKEGDLTTPNTALVWQETRVYVKLI